MAKTNLRAESACDNSPFNGTGNLIRQINAASLGLRYAQAALYAVLEGDMLDNPERPGTAGLLLEMAAQQVVEAISEVGRIGCIPVGVEAPRTELEAIDKADTVTRHRASADRPTQYMIALANMRNAETALNGSRGLTEDEKEILSSDFQAADAIFNDTPPASAEEFLHKFLCLCNDEGYPGEDLLYQLRDQVQPLAKVL